jgi:hypothetical protein
MYALLSAAHTQLHKFFGLVRDSLLLPDQVGPARTSRSGGHAQLLLVQDCSSNSFWAKSPASVDMGAISWCAAVHVPGA